MERITYRITLDTHKNGIQRTLQGFETADNMARRIAVNLMSGGDTYEIPSDNVVAMIYVTTPNAEEPSINECTIEGNTLVYDALPIVEEGITEMQIKLIKTSAEGAKRVIASPKFAVEVSKSGVDDENAEHTTTFTALENAVAQARNVYDHRVVRVYIEPDCTFKVEYADGTIYENEYFREALYNGNAILAESWAKGETGSREGEDTDNSKYYSDVSKSSARNASRSADEVRKMVDEAQMYSAYTIFEVNYETGELTYLSRNYKFEVDEDSGELLIDGGADYTPERLVRTEVDKHIAGTIAMFDQLVAVERARIDSFTSLDEGSTTGDAELIDGRTDNEGNVWDNIGGHVRGVTKKLSGKIAELKEDAAWIPNYPSLPTQGYKWYNAKFDGEGKYSESAYHIQMPEWESSYIVDRDIKVKVDSGDYLFNVFIFNRYGVYNYETLVGVLKDGYTNDEVIIEKEKYANCYYSVVLCKADGSEIATGECVHVKAYREIILDNHFVTPDMFGAIGDGVTNDGAALRMALSLGKKVVIPKGKYAFDYIEIPNSCEIEGCGYESMLINSIESDKTSAIYNNSNESINIRLKDFTLLGKLDLENGILLDNTDGPSNGDDHWNMLENLHVEGFQHGIHLKRNRESRIRNCTVRNCFNGFYIENCSDGYVEGCTSSQNTNHGFSFAAGANYRFTNSKAFMNGNSGFRLSPYSENAFVIVQGCETQSNAMNGITVDNTKLVTISECNFDSDANLIKLNNVDLIKISCMCRILKSFGGDTFLKSVGNLSNADINIMLINVDSGSELYAFDTTPTNTKLTINMETHIG